VEPIVGRDKPLPGGAYGATAESIGAAVRFTPRGFEVGQLPGDVDDTPTEP
jgi:hypothetical protein